MISKNSSFVMVSVDIKNKFVNIYDFRGIQVV